MIKKHLKNEKGVTGVDIVISIMVITTFVGLVTSLMSKIYRTSSEIQESSNAMAYLTIVAEKVDEKSFEDVISSSDFVEKLKNDGEISIDSKYVITVTQSEIDGINKDYVRRIDLSVKYKVADSEKTINMAKLKVKEV